jgi:hypothetical protein
MAEAIDRAHRRKLISQAARRFRQRQGAPPADPSPDPACPTCGGWPAGRETGAGARTRP